jgi:L,D-transpeptidase YcbB
MTPAIRLADLRPFAPWARRARPVTDTLRQPMHHHSTPARRGSILVAVAAAASLWTSVSDAAADPAAVREALQERVALLREGRPGPAARESVMSRSVLPMLYEADGFAARWTDPARVAALLRALDGLSADGLNPADYHVEELRRRAAAGRAQTAAEAADFDLLASDALVLALCHLESGKVNPKTVIADWNFNPHPLTDATIATAARRAVESGRVEEEFSAARPDHWMYARGRELLAQYRSIAARGGWPRIAAGPTLKPGMSDPRVPALRSRLAAEGDYTGAASTDTAYDESLVAAMKAFQERHLLDADGVVGPAVLKEVNVSAEERVNQIRVNLERARWVLHEIGSEDHVLVDIAGYGVRFMHDRRPAWQSRAIVGQPYRQTPSFRAEIQYVVFNPTWTVPPTILAKDILPHMRSGTNVLKKKHLKVIDNQGREVDPSTINWSQVTTKNFPYQLRQDPGDDNALGRVKIMFPNPHLVYLHDTPSKSLFDKDRRNFSSGCIRVEKPRELAELVLADSTNWNRAAIDATIDKGDQRTVNLKKRIPVLLIYWTVDQDAGGRPVFKPDVYGQDAQLRAALDRRAPGAAH